MRIMREDYTFPVTKAQLERHFKKWNLKKNRTKQDWTIITTKVKKRKREGKESEVYSYGKPVSQKRICQEMSRSCLIADGTSNGELALRTPPTPDGIQILTPSSHLVQNLQIELPSYRLMNSLIEQEVWPTPPYHLETSMSVVLRPMVSSAYLRFENDQTHDTSVRRLIDRFIKTDQTLKSDNENFPSIKISTRLLSYTKMGALLRQSGSHEKSLILSSHIIPYINAVMFYLSNNLLDTVDEKRHIARLLDMIKPADLVQLLTRTLSAKHPSAEALAERLLRHSIVYQHIEVVQVLLRSGMNPNHPVTSYYGFDTFTPLNRAVDRGDLAMIQSLIDYGANVNQIDSGSGKSALHFANFDLEVIQLLLEAGADVNHLDADGHNCIQSAFIIGYRGSGDWYRGKKRTIIKQVIEKYHEKGLDLNHHCQSTCSILNMAIAYGDLELVTFLLARGVHVTDRTVYYAVKSGDPLILQFLQSVRIPLPRTLLSTDFLTSTIYNEHFKMTEFLLARGAPVDPEPGADSEESIAREFFEAHMRDSPFPFYSRTPISAACLVDRPNLVRELIRRYESMKSPSANGYLKDILEALLVAVEEGHLNIMNMLLEARAKFGTVPHVDGESQSVLTTAVEVGNMEMVETLLNAGFGTPDAGSGGRLALSAAVRRGSKDFIALFRTSKLYLDPQIGGVFSRNYSPYQTPIVEAILTNNIDLAVELLEAGVDVNNHSAKICGRTALEAAVTIRNFHLIELLISYGADTDDPWALLHAVMNPPNLDIARFLVKAHQEQRGNLRSGFGVIALRYAARQNDIDVLQYLISTGLNLNEKSVPPREKAAFRSTEELAGQSVICMSKDSALERERSVLEVAISRDHAEMVRKLLDAGADPNLPATGPFGRTALQIAAENGNVAIVEHLLTANCDVNEPPAANGGVTALQAAAVIGDIGLARLLISHEADVNAFGARENGRTALEGAAEHGRIDMLQLLLDCGAEIHDCGKGQYERSLELARNEGHFAAEKMLKRYHQSTLSAYTTSNINQNHSEGEVMTTLDSNISYETQELMRPEAQNTNINYPISNILDGIDDHFPDLFEQPHMEFEAELDFRLV